MPNKQFAERLHKELDVMGVPQHGRERLDVFSKLLKLPRFKAQAILEGMMPDPQILDNLGRELEVDVDWLIGKSPGSKEQH